MLRQQAMNGSIHKSQRKEEGEETPGGGKKELPEVLQEHNLQQCQLPLPKYDSGGFFKGYAQATTFEENASSSFIGHDEKLKEVLATPEKSVDLKQKEEIGKDVVEEEAANNYRPEPFTKAAAATTISFNPKLKAHRRAESKNRGRRTLFNSGWNNHGGSQHIASMTLYSNGSTKKTSVKDFDYLKFLNDTILKDEVLDQFMQRASEFEQAAGPKSKGSPSKKRTANLSAVEIAQRDPHRFYTVTRFEQLLAKKTSKSALRNTKDYQSGSPAKERRCAQVELRQRCGSCTSQRRGSHRSSQGSRSAKARPGGVANAVSMKKDFQRKAKKTAKFPVNEADSQMVGRNRDRTPRGRATSTNPLSSTPKARQEAHERNGDGHASQARGGSRINLLLEKRALSKERGGRRIAGKPGDAQSKDAIETTTGGNSVVAEGRKLLSKLWTKPGTATGKGRSTSAAANEDLPREEHASKPKGGRAKSRKRDRPSPRDRGATSKASALHSPRGSPGGGAQLADAPNLEFQPAQEAAGPAAAAKDPKAVASPTPRQSVITNIKGNVNDKMRLTSRLNAAVEDLIKMGQKYKKRSEVVSRKIDQDRYSTIRNSNPSTLVAEGRKSSLAPQLEKGDMVEPVVQSTAGRMEMSLTSMTGMRNRADGGESPTMNAHHGRRQKTLTAASGITISQVKPVDQFRRSSEHLRRASNYARKSGGSVARRSGSIEFPSAAKRAHEKMARTSGNKRADKLLPHEYTGQPKEAGQEGKRHDRQRQAHKSYDTATGCFARKRAAAGGEESRSRSKLNSSLEPILVSRDPSSPGYGPYGSTGTARRSRLDQHGRKHSDATLPQLPGTTQSPRPVCSRSNAQQASRHPGAQGSALCRGGSGQAVHEESSCSLKSSKNLYRDRQESDPTSTVEPVGVAGRDSSAPAPAEDAKLRNQLEKIYLKKQAVYGPPPEHTALTGSQKDLAIAVKKAKQAHGASIVVEQKLKTLRKIQPVLQRTRDEQQRVTDELVQPKDEQLKEPGESQESQLQAHTTFQKYRKRLNMGSHPASVHTATPDGTRALEPVLGRRDRHAVLGALHHGRASPREQGPTESGSRLPSRSGASVGSDGHAHRHEAAPSLRSPQEPEARQSKARKQSDTLLPLHQQALAAGPKPAGTGNFPLSNMATPTVLPSKGQLDPQLTDDYSTRLPLPVVDGQGSPVDRDATGAGPPFVAAQRAPSRVRSGAGASQRSPSIGKDEAITMLQEGPRDQFSNVLKAYLTQQSEYREAGLSVGLGAQGAGADHADMYSQPLLLESQFSKAQQLLLQPKCSSRAAQNQAKAAVGTAQLVRAHIQKGANEQAYFNRKAQHERIHAQHPGNQASSRLPKPLRGMNSTAVMAEIAHAEQLAAQSKELAHPSVPASWLPVAQPQLSPNETRSRSFGKVSPSSGTATAPFLREKAATPFLVQEKGPITNFSALSQSHERKSQDKEGVVKLSKLRNTYKPLIQEKSHSRPVSMLQQPPPQVRQSSQQRRNIVVDARAQPANQQQRIFSSRSGGKDVGQLMVSSAPMNAKAGGAYSWKQSPVGTQLTTHELQSATAPCASPRLASSKQERYPAGGIRSRPAKKTPSSPIQSAWINKEGHSNSLKLKQQSAEIICTTTVGTGHSSPADYAVRQRAQRADGFNRKSVNEPARRSAVPVNDLLQRTKATAKAPKTNASVHLPQSGQPRPQQHSKAYSQPAREPVRRQERQESAFRKRSNPIKTHQYKGGNPQQPEAMDQVVASGEQDMRDSKNGRLRELQQHSEAAFTPASPPPEGHRTQKSARRRRERAEKNLAYAQASHSGAAAKGKDDARQGDHQQLRKPQRTKTTKQAHGNVPTAADSQDYSPAGDAHRNPAQELGSNAVLLEPLESAVGGMLDAAEPLSSEPKHHEEPLPTVLINVPTGPEASIPDQPFQPKYAFGRPEGQGRTFAAIKESKEAAERLTVEERLAQSSIMAMHLDGLGSAADRSEADGHKFFALHSARAVQ